MGSQQRRNKPTLQLDGDPLWYKDSVLYELHVRAFYDSNDDGMGDFAGLAQKLDYLHDLGVTAVWLLPFCPSPLKDDGYDIADYANVHSTYGTLGDFKMFLREAHLRGLRVITELVLNHTSDQHPWFQRARRAPAASPWRDFYIWSDTAEKYKEARIIFKDSENSNWTWDPVARAYYWHRFYAHQPDLNFDSPDVRKAMFQVVDFWLGLGVDGLRLDAVPYLYQREGTNCENLPETHAFLRDLRRHVDARFSSRMLLAEANQWPEDAAAYFGEGDACHMAFHFPLMPRIFVAVRVEDRFPIIDILSQTPAIPEACQWAVFLRNHDELTLEMVTDEERDYMYRTYAQDPQMRINLGIRRRLAPLMGNDRKKIELLNGLLFSLPGTPVIYYGDELGMGDNIYAGDRNGVRTPMQWSADRNAGFSRANSQRLYLPIIVDPDYHYEAVNVEAQQNNPHSLLWWMKRLITLRKSFKAFGRGTLEFLYPENRKVLAFVRRYQQECILVVANLSRVAQYVELDLSEFKGMTPVELSGQTEFPPIGETPYLLTLGAYAFYWFALEPQPRVAAEIAAPAGEIAVSTLTVAADWESVFEGRAKAALEKSLGPVLRRRRWFGGKARRMQSTSIVDVIPFTEAPVPCYFVLVQVEYTDGDPEMYALALALASGERAAQVQAEMGEAVVARLSRKDTSEEALLYEALRERGFCEGLLRAIARRRRFRGLAGEVSASPTRLYRRLRGSEGASLEVSLLKAEQTNSSVIYGSQLILKIFRRLESGPNPDLELSAFLSEQASFPHVPPLAGSLLYRRNRGEPMTLGILQGFVANEGDAWQYTLDHLSRYYEQAVAQLPQTREAPCSPVPLLDLVEMEPPPIVAEMIGTYLEPARLLGQRTAEMHVAFASDTDDPNFTPEPFSELYQRSIYQSMRSLAAHVFDLLRKRLKDIPPAAREDARKVLGLEDEVRRRFRSLLERKITAMRTRLHGDYHLGQVLYTGKDFVIIDFEGEPARPLSERRIKRSPLRDVAGMLRSFHYAALTALYGQVSGGVVRPEDVNVLGGWARCWHHWVSAAFLKTYLQVAGGAPSLPKTRDELAILLNAYQLEKAVYELGYELNNRPDWVRLPLQGILELLETNG
jgi:maltose alpha-D-glucosyltransferase/alpha-amylase